MCFSNCKLQYNFWNYDQFSLFRNNQDEVTLSLSSISLLVFLTYLFVFLILTFTTDHATFKTKSELIIYKTFNHQSFLFPQYCVTYCIGNITELSMHEACYDSISSEALHATVNGSLLSQHVYESNISQHASVAYNVLQLSLTPGNKVNQ